MTRPSRRYLAVEHDIDPTAVDGSGRTPLEVAKRAQKQSVIDFLEEFQPTDGFEPRTTMDQTASCVNACTGTSGDCIVS